MLKYILNRVFQAFIVLFLASLVTFILVNVAPGDPVLSMLNKRADQPTIDRVRKELGLDKPLPNQYIDFVTKAIKFDFGKSYFHKTPVSEMIQRAFPVTLKLALMALVFAAVFGITIGTLAAIFRGGIIDKLVMSFAIFQISAPVFWFAMILQLFLGLRLKLLPVSGLSNPLGMVMPVVVLGLRYGATSARLIRTNMIEVLSQDYVRTARAKGIKEFIVVMKHVLKNAAIPIVTLLGSQLRSLLGGAIVVERVFAISGLGKVAIDAVMSRDIPIIQGTVLYSAFIFVIINLIVDLSYGLMDPRVRITRGAS